MGTERYRTIVADPPWPSGSMPRHFAQRRRSGTGREQLAYETMSIEEIAALPIGGMVGPNAHLYLWTINAFVESAYEVARGWGFQPVNLLTWAKRPRGIGLGGTFTNSTEFILFCRRGSLPALSKQDSTWWLWKRPYSSRGPIHSAKPDAFLDLVEQASPGPYLELFARRARFGWDYWGDESLQTVELAT